MYQAPTAPQSIGGVLDNGFKLFRESFVQVFLLAVATSLVTAPSNYAGLYVLQNGSTPNVIGTLVGAGLLIALIATILLGAIVARIDGVARGEAVSVGDALSIGINRLPAMVVSWILVGLVVGVGLVLLIIPGLILAIWLLFGPYAVVVERLGPLQSLSYSWAIVRGHWWRTAALVTIVGIILIVIYIVLGIVASIAVFTNPETLSTGQMPWYVQFIVGPLLSGIAGPLGYAMLLAIYYDLKLRHEGGDLAARIAATA
jgi:Uncharacterised protein family (UPF0259)